MIRQSREIRVLEILSAMDTRRQLYFGPSPAVFSAACGFIAGFVCAKSGAADLPWNTFDPPGFRDFVVQQIRADCGEGVGWQEIVRQHTASEDEALTLYLKLLKEFVAGGQYVEARGSS
jgi:hypothetical protein